MPWTVQPDRKLGIVEVNLEGDYTADELRQCTPRAVRLGQEMGINRFLIDASELVVAPPVVDILKLPAGDYTKLGLDRQSRIAITLPANQEARAAAQFYETACLNRGWNVKLLPDRSAATQWLLGATP